MTVSIIEKEYSPNDDDYPVQFWDAADKSIGIDGWSFLSPHTRTWLGGLSRQLPKGFTVHLDEFADMATRLAHAAGFVLGTKIFLTRSPTHDPELLLRHELVHLAQVEASRNGARIAHPSWTEREAHWISRLKVGREIQHGASPSIPHRLAWFIPVGIGLYILMRPGVANAPGPRDRLIKSPSLPQITGEALAIFIVPGGALKLGGRLGFGFLGKSALAGAATNVSLRASQDIGRGSVSAPSLYFFDAGSGAILGYVVPGGIRLIGQAGTRSLDSLAAYGLSNSDLAVARLLHQAAPVNADAARRILMQRGMAGKISRWWLDHRGQIVLYRGQNAPTEAILSPMARTSGVTASENMVARMRVQGFSDSEIAGFTARYHDSVMPHFLAPKDLANLRPGSVGIPTTRIPSIASGFADDGVIYVIRVPKSMAHVPHGWQGLAAESEHVIFNQIPNGSIISVIPAKSVGPLKVDQFGQLILSR